MGKGSCSTTALSLNSKLPHVEMRRMKTKICKKCGLEKPVEEFGKKLNGWTALCSECTRQRDRERYAANQPEIRKTQNLYYSGNSAKIMAQMKQALKDNPERGLLKLARQRCKKSGVPCTISEADIVIPEFCPILGLKLEFGEMDNRNSSPSLDRISPELGYIPGNVAVISYRANRIKNEGSADEHRKIADWIDAQTPGTPKSDPGVKATRLTPFAQKTFRIEDPQC
jgi:hypothetical protein